MFETQCNSTERGFMENKFVVTMAVSGIFEQDKRILECAEALGLRSDVRLNMVHVYPYYPRISGSEQTEIAEIQDDDALDLAQKTLNSYRLLLDPQIEIETKVLRGRIADELLSYAAAAYSHMLLIGFDPDGSKFFPNELSVTSELLEKSLIPVLVVSKNTKMDSLGELRLIIADDLSEESDRVIEYAAKTANALGNTRLIDAHIENLRSDRVNTSILKVYMLSLGGLEAFGISNDRVLENVRARIKRHMDERIDKLKEMRQIPDMSIQTMVLEGQPIDSLKKSVDRLRADIVVFGKHKKFRDGGPFFGGIKEKAMLGLGVPVLIVP
jgi:nucleotide-binding universal stress UspA family protein